MKKITQEDYQKRLDRITEMFSGMVEHADEQSQFRCPYRNRHDECTAKIRCRNQVPLAKKELPRTKDVLFMCNHDGSFDYRDAWDSDPRSVEKARKKVDQIKKKAEARRKND